MLDSLTQLFRGRKISTADLAAALQDVDRERRRCRVAVRRWERQRRQIVERLKRSRGEKNSIEVDYLWDELKSHREVGQDLRREARAHNVEGIALKRSIRMLEQLEKSKDREGVRQLLERVQRSGVLERMAIHRDSQSECLREMSELLEDFGGEADEPADPEKALFLAELDLIAQKEQRGEAEDATDREDDLLERFQAASPEAD
ncbi:MAG: hypothetical protein AAF488_06335 [Planctomycetota bacterium]